jgi:hypothetical protein
MVDKAKNNPHAGADARENAMTRNALIEAMAESPNKDTPIEPDRAPMPVGPAFQPDQLTETTVASSAAAEHENLFDRNPQTRRALRRR